MINFKLPLYDISNKVGEADYDNEHKLNFEDKMDFKCIIYNFP